jgi:predicted phage tail protein
LAESSGIGYSGLIYGTGYPRGFYNLSVDTNPKNLDLIQEGSLYILKGSGVEPKLYKTISTKEEEANQYGIVGMQYSPDKQESIERDTIDTSPSYYVRGPYDIVIKPESPDLMTSTGIYQSTGLYFTWGASPSQISAYKVYVSRPDYSTTIESDSITEAYSVPAGTTTLTIPINQIYGFYDISVYAQGLQYKVLSTDAAETGVIVLPTPSLSIAGKTLTSTIPSGITIYTADINRLNYSIGYGTTHSPGHRRPRISQRTGKAFQPLGAESFGRCQAGCLL